MTPFLKNKSDQKKPYKFYFAIDRSKITPKQMQIELEEFGFKKLKPNKEVDKGQFDFVMSIRIETHYNPTKFANDLIKKYKNQIMEIKIL